MDKIDDDTDVEEYVMSVSGYPRFNELMLPHGRSQPQFKELSFTEGHFDPIHGAVSKFQYIHPEGSQVRLRKATMDLYVCLGGQVIGASLCTCVVYADEPCGALPGVALWRARNTADRGVMLNEPMFW